MSLDRIPAIRALLTSTCHVCGGDGWLGNYPPPGEPVDTSRTCTACSGLGYIEDESHENHLAWCVAEIERLRKRDKTWQESTGRKDPPV